MCTRLEGIAIGIVIEGIVTYPHTIQSELLDIRASPHIIRLNLCGSQGANLTPIVACATCPQENITHGSRNLHELACDLEIYCSIDARLEGIDIVRYCDVSTRNPERYVRYLGVSAYYLVEPMKGYPRPVGADVTYVLRSRILCT